MKHIVATTLIALTLTGCATSNSLLDGLLGRYHNYDPIEYAQTVNLVIDARSLEPACTDPETYRYHLSVLQTATQDLRAYAEGRPYNQRTVTLANSMDKLIADTASKDTMSAFFCRERSKNIVKAAEILRTASGEKPE